MTTSTLDVRDLFSVLGAHGIKRQLKRVAGVDRVWVDPVSSSATVVYDQTKTSLSAIQAAIRDCGFYGAGEALVGHVCDDQPMPGRTPPGGPISQIKPPEARVSLGDAGLAPAETTPAGEEHGGRPCQHSRSSLATPSPSSARTRLNGSLRSTDERPFTDIKGG